MSETLYLVGGPDASKSGREFFQTVSMTTCIPETPAISAAKHLYQEEFEKELLRLVTMRDDFEGLVVNNGLVELCSCDLSFLLEFPNAHIASIEISPMQENAFELFWEMLSFLARRLNLSIYQAEQETKIELNSCKIRREKGLDSGLKRDLSSRTG